MPADVPTKKKKKKRKYTTVEKPVSKYSADPKHIRGRIRRANKNMKAVKRDVALLYGKPVEEWDFEELQYGCPRKPNGKFPSKKPPWITPIVMSEAQRRLRTMSQAELGMYAGMAIRAIGELLVQTKSPQTKFAAAQYILNQVIGMPTRHVELGGSVELRSLLAECIVNPDGVAAHPLQIGEGVIDAEVVEEVPDE